jgi:WD40 repeat protein
VRSVEFSPDGKLLLSASWDKTARIWNVSPSDWPVQEIKVFAELESSHRIGDGGTIGTLDGTRISQLLKQFNTERHGSPPVP